MLWLIPIIISSILAASAIIIIVYEIIKKQTIKKVAKEQEIRALNAKIKKIFSDGEYEIVKVGLLDAHNKNIDDIEIKSEYGMDNNLYKGQIIKLTT